MYGDVFGNRDPEVYGQDVGRESGSRTPTDTHTPTHVHRWQPVFEQERITARYGAFARQPKQGLRYASPVSTFSKQSCAWCFGMVPQLNERPVQLSNVIVSLLGVLSLMCRTCCRCACSKQAR